MRQNKELVKLMIIFIKLNTIESHINTFFELLFELLHDEVTQLNVRCFQIVVVNDDVKVSRSLAVIEFDLCSV